MGKRSKQKRTWGPHDAALWHTVQRALDIDDARWEALPDRPVAFARNVPEERILEVGDYQLQEWTAPGDGTYYRSGGYVVGYGRGAAAMSVGLALGTAIGNSKRAAAAAAAAVPRWMTTDAGVMHVSTHGFYLTSSVGHRYWSWEGIDQVTVVEPSVIGMQGRSTRGPVSWRFQGTWSELVFNLWARARNRQHPQLVSGSWLHPAWAGWAAEQGYPLPTRAIEMLGLEPGRRKNS